MPVPLVLGGVDRVVLVEPPVPRLLVDDVLVLVDVDHEVEVVLLGLPLASRSWR